VQALKFCRQSLARARAEVVLGMKCNSSFRNPHSPERKQHAPFRTELQNHVRTDIRGPYVVLWIDANHVRCYEQIIGADRTLIRAGRRSIELQRPGANRDKLCQKRVWRAFLIMGSSFLPRVPESADPNEWNRILDQRGANTGSYGFYRPCLAS
jgi:hypothetical protein